MKRLLLLSGFILVASASAFSQLGIKAGLGVNVEFPAADLGDALATGFGGTAMAKLPLTPMIDATGGVEYINFTSKDVNAGGTTGSNEGHAWGYFVGGRLSVLVVGYVGLELGGYTFTTEFSAPNIPGTSGTNTEFFYAPIVGVNFGMFDVNGRYVVADGSNFVSLRGMIWF